MTKFKLTNEALQELIKMEAISKFTYESKDSKEKKEDPVISLKARSVRGKSVLMLTAKNNGGESCKRAVPVTAEGELEQTVASAKANEFFGFLHAVENTEGDITVELPNIEKDEKGNVVAESMTGTFSGNGFTIGDVRYLPYEKVEPATESDALSLTVKRETFDAALAEVGTEKVSFLLTGDKQLTIVGMNGSVMVRRKVISLEAVGAKGEIYKGYLNAENGYKVDGKFFGFTLSKNGIARIRTADDAENVNLLCTDKSVAARTATTRVEALVIAGGMEEANTKNAQMDFLIDQANKGNLMLAFVKREDLFGAMSSIRAVSNVLKARGEDVAAGAASIEPAGENTVNLSLGEAVMTVKALSSKVAKETGPLAFSLVLLDIAARAMGKAEVIAISLSLVNKMHCIMLTPVRKNESGKGLSIDVTTQIFLAGVKAKAAQAKKEEKAKKEPEVTEEEVKAAEESSEDFMTA